MRPRSDCGTLHSRRRYARPREPIAHDSEPDLDVLVTLIKVADELDDWFAVGMATLDAYRASPRSRRDDVVADIHSFTATNVPAEVVTPRARRTRILKHSLRRSPVDKGNTAPFRSC